MTPEQWGRLTPQQQAAHITAYGPPPPHYHQRSATLSQPLPHPLATTRKSRKGLWISLSVVGGVLLLVIVLAAIGGSRSANTTADSCRGTGCTATLPQKPAAAQSPGIVADGPPKAITARDWALIAKDPAAHVGQAIIVYGQVKQFDSVTGTGTFRANVDGVQHKVSYGYADYDTNTILEGDQSTLNQVVEGDLFRAEVVVAGTYSYETTMGGQLTAPVLAVSAIKVIGSAK